MNRILNPAQAEAVYSAMCALNNVGMRLDADNGDVRVYENPIGQVRVAQWDTEVHASQAAFASAYGLNPDDSEPAYQPTHDEGSTP